MKNNRSGVKRKKKKREDQEVMRILMNFFIKLSKNINPKIQVTRAFIRMTFTWISCSKILRQSLQWNLLILERISCSLSKMTFTNSAN